MTTHRPAPPPGFTAFKWKHRCIKDTGVQICPHCGAPKDTDDKWGYAWGGGGFTDPGAQALLEQLTADGGGYLGYEAFGTQYEGVQLRCHWSRYSGGHCLQCQCEFWHDFGGAKAPGDQPWPEWRYHYKPPSGQITLL